MLTVAVRGDAALHTALAPLVPVALNAPAVTVPALPVADAVNVTVTVSPEVTTLWSAFRAVVAMFEAMPGLSAIIIWVW